MKHIGIMGAMAEEVALLRSRMSHAMIERRGMREYVSGRLRGRFVTLVFSRWGKVAAASTATTLIERFNVDGLVFTGVAGALDENLNIGDIVVADTLVQHDMDASALPGIARFEIPMLGVSRFSVAAELVAVARRAAEVYLEQDLAVDLSPEVLRSFHIEMPRVVVGAVASGDRFIADAEEIRLLREALPGLMCVEMEGAAVAQVAHEHALPCLVMRTISDKADHGAIVDFPRFVSRVASNFTCGAVLRLLEGLES